jgi:hypothetical protein
LAVEPDPTARTVAAERGREAAVQIDVVDGTAEALPAADGAFDAALAVWVLCSVPDPSAALAELRPSSDQAVNCASTSTFAPRTQRSTGSSARSMRCSGRGSSAAA